MLRFTVNSGIVRSKVREKGEKKRPEVGVTNKKSNVRGEKGRFDMERATCRKP